MDMFGIFQMHPDWTLPSQIDENPMAWMIMVNGLIVDAGHAAGNPGNSLSQGADTLHARLESQRP